MELNNVSGVQDPYLSVVHPYMITDEDLTPSRSSTYCVVCVGGKLILLFCRSSWGVAASYRKIKYWRGHILIAIEMHHFYIVDDVRY